MRDFADARVAVTGATGFIGGVVARKLLDAGAHVTALTRDRAHARPLAERGARVVEANVTDPATLDFADQDVVIHAAAWVGMGVPERKRRLFWDTNVHGTKHVLDAARRADVPRIVHVSSIAALGRTRRGEPATEADFARRPDRYASYYEESKTAAHALALDALAAGARVAIPMPGVVLGRGGPFDPVFERFARGKLPALPKGDGVKGWVHVEDTADGILSAALTGKGPYLLVDDCVTLTELLARLSHLVDVPKPERRVPVGVLAAAAGLVERAYHAVGKTPPVSRELVVSLREPMKYDSSRARKGLAWSPDMWSRLTRELRETKEDATKGRKRRA